MIVIACNQTEMPVGSNGLHVFLLRLASIRSRALEELTFSSKLPGGLGLGGGDFDIKDRGQGTWAIGSPFFEHPQFCLCWSHREITWVKALLSVFLE